MELSIETVKYVSNLARIELNAKELEGLASQLKDILGFIDKLNRLDVENVKPTSHILPLSNVLREDVISASLPNDMVIKNAPQKDGNFFVVPKVIE